MEALLEEEIIAARLYTGPMYAKYNDVLRVIGDLRSGGADSEGDELRVESYSSEELSKKLKEKQLENEKAARLREAEKRKKDEDSGRRRSTASAFHGPALPEEIHITGNTLGNLYTTTLHVINSAVLKLGKLARVETVYRGISRKTMPRKMVHKDPSDNTRGGIEYGFTSASVRKEEAVRYATIHSKGLTASNKTPVLLEITQGLIDRGADLKWLSQYPHEAEGARPMAL